MNELLILTAFNSGFSKVGEMCVESIARYCARTGARFVSRIIPDDYPRPPSWFKIDFIKENLSEGNIVLWVDADAMIVDTLGRIEEVLHPSSCLNICNDENGINCGIMAWRDTPQAMDALNRVGSLYEEFKDHKWWEQAALQTFINDLSPHFPHKRVFNAYTNEFCPDTKIVHFPGFSLDERLILMEAQNIGIRRNGHGRTK